MNINISDLLCDSGFHILKIYSNPLQGLKGMRLIYYVIINKDIKEEYISIDFLDNLIGNNIILTIKEDQIISKHKVNLTNHIFFNDNFICFDNNQIIKMESYFYIPTSINELDFLLNISKIKELLKK